MNVLVLEASTSSAKAMVYNKTKGIVAIEEEAFPREANNAGRQDAVLIYELIINVAKKAVKGHDIEAVSISGVWHTIIPCDQNKNPAAPSIVWTFTKTQEICKKIRKQTELANNIYSRTGCMPNITYAPYGIMYLKEEENMDLSNKFFMSQGAYIFYKLTGECRETPNIVSGMGLLNIHTKTYDDFILDYIGINKDQLPALADYTCTFPLKAEIADLLGIKAGIPVVPPHSDGALNQVGNCAGKKGIMTFSVGTSAAIRMITAEPVLSSPPATWCYVGVEGWLAGAATAGACNCINWFKEEVLKDKFSFKELEDKLLSHDETPVFLPFLFGERCPGWEIESGGFENVNGNYDAADLFRGISEGVLFNIYHCFEILTKLSGKPSKIIMSGGILNSPKWSQMAADIFGMTIHLSDNAQASLLGGAVLALCSAGGLSHPDEFQNTDDLCVNPIPENAAIYRLKFEKYLKAYKSLSKRQA